MLIYLAAPYTSPSAQVREMRVKETSRIAARLMLSYDAFQEPNTVFSPITHGHALVEHLPEQAAHSHDFWMDRCLPILEVCDLLVIVPLHGWGKSLGIAKEIQHAKACGIPLSIYQEANPLLDIVSPDAIFSIFRGDHS